MKSHAYVVVKHAIELSDHTDKPVELVVAALIHDLGNTYCSLRKIVESELDGDNTVVKQQLSWGQRVEHEKWSVEKGIPFLEALRMSSGFIVSVVKLIINHDDHKVTGIHPTGINALLLRECDVLWMLSPDGIQRDIDRAIENGYEVKTPEEQWNYNFDKVGDLIVYGKYIAEGYRKQMFEKQGE